jgi:hypothetical protein
MSGRCGLGLSERAVQGPKFEFRVLIPGTRSVILTDVNLM